MADDILNLNGTIDTGLESIDTGIGDLDVSKLKISLDINCSTNPLLDLLNAMKDALSSALAGLAAAGAAALSALKSALEAVKNALLGLIPEIPEIPNFIKEFAALIAQGALLTAGVIAAFIARWGNVVDNLQDLINAGLAFEIDLCADVPNIDATDIDPTTGVVTGAKDKGATPTTATAIPKTSVSLTPTVVSNENLPSVSVALTGGETRNSLKSVMETSIKEATNVIKVKTNTSKEHKRKMVSLKATPEWREMTKAKDDYKHRSIQDFYNSGNATPSQKKLIDDMYNSFNAEKEVFAERTYMMQLQKHFSEAYDDASWDSYKLIQTKGPQVYTKSGGNMSVRFEPELSEASRRKVEQEILSVMNKNKSGIISWNKYKLNVE